MQLLNFAVSAITAIQTGNIMGFVGGVIGGAVFGALGENFALGVAGALGKASYTFGGGFLIGAVEFGISGFGAGFVGALAGGADFGDALMSGGLGAASGAIMGGIIQGSYMAGWQKSAHGLSEDRIADKTGWRRVEVGSRSAVGPGRHKFIRWKEGKETHYWEMTNNH